MDWLLSLTHVYFSSEHCYVCILFYYLYFGSQTRLPQIAPRQTNKVFRIGLNFKVA